MTPYISIIAQYLELFGLIELVALLPEQNGSFVIFGIDVFTFNDILEYVMSSLMKVLYETFEQIIDFFYASNQCSTFLKLK